MHNEYNNLYYWSNDFINQLEGGKVEKDQKNEKNQKNGMKSMREHDISDKLDQDFDYEAWLEDNLWKYYD